MALNFSHGPIFPANPYEENLVSSIRISNGYVVEGIPDKYGDGFGKPRSFNWEIEDSYDCTRDRGDRGGGPHDPISNDILDILPSDPFGMDISATFTAITGWIEDMEGDSENYVGDDEAGGKRGDYQFVAGLNFIWNRALRFQTESHGERSNPVGGVDGWVDEKEFGDGSCDGRFVSVCNVEEFLSFGDEDSRAVSHGPPHDDCHEAAENCLNGEGDAPHEALFFALGYLGVQDLLSAERVCRSLCSAVQNDTLLWMNIQIDQPLSERITDDALMNLTSRAQGNLQSLSLVECWRITDDGLKRVLETNPRLKKLSVPGCTRLSVEGIVNNLKAFKSSSAPGIKHLRIGGLYGVTNKHYEELKPLLGLDNCQQLKDHKPRFYHSGHLSLSCDDDRAIDIEMCPRCQNLRLVYDCPAESCQAKQGASQLCRACILCIARCVQCGRCFNDSEYEETFCLDLLCSGCWKQLLNCPERHEDKDFSSKHTIFHHETRYHFRLYG